MQESAGNADRIDFSGAAPEAGYFANGRDNCGGAERLWELLQREEPDDFVIASGIAHSLEDFVAAAFGQVGLDWRDHVEHDPALTRPSEILCSLGDPAKAAKVLGWRPTVGFPEIVSRMIRAEHGGVPGADGLATEAGYQPI